MEFCTESMVQKISKKSQGLLTKPKNNGGKLPGSLVQIQNNTKQTQTNSPLGRGIHKKRKKPRKTYQTCKRKYLWNQSPKEESER